MGSILNILLCILFLIFGSGANAQSNFPKCFAKIQERLDALGEAGKQRFNLYVVRDEIKGFDFGKVQEFTVDANKAKAFKRVYESLSEFIDLTGDQLSAKGMKGYTKFTGGIIRVDGTDFVSDLQAVFGGVSTFDKPGFNKVMERLGETGSWLAQGKWQSPGGLIFDVAPANRQGHRVSHVFTHTVPGWNGRPPADHSVFSVARDDLLPLLDEAWSRRPPVNPNDPGAFLVDMGRAVGTNGQTKINLVVRPNTAEVITAYPQP
jgi:hypothetical protein